MDRYPISASSLEKFYYVDGHQLERQYKDHLSGYHEWEALEHADQWLVFPDNVGSRLSIDETSLSNGELYTIVTNKDAHGRKGALVAMVAGTKSDVVSEALDVIPEDVRAVVEEVTMDLSPTMRRIAVFEFPNAKKVIDRFHVQSLANDALQDIRIKHRWEAINEENEELLMARAAGRDYVPVTYANGDTRRQLLARSRHLLFKSAEKWTASQKERAAILFEQYPDLKEGYNLVHGLRMIYAKSKSYETALPKLALWYNKVTGSGFKEFTSVAETIQANYPDILNFFNNRATNASAESFNSKVKAFRAQLRGMTDTKYFLYRLCNIYA